MSPTRISRHLDASTAHITQIDNDLLRANVDGSNCSAPRKGLRINEHSYGYIVFLPGEAGDIDGRLAQHREMGFSESFEKLVRLAVDKRCDLINLDRDGQIIEELPAHDW